MKTRDNLGFGPDENEDIVPEKPKADLIDISGFKPTPASRPDKANIAEAAAKAQFKSREPRAELAPATAPVPAAAPARTQRRHRTGRCAQLNLKLRPETIADFYAVADAQGWVLGEAFERAVVLLKAQQAKTR
jgi:hypothetical protein